MSKITPEHLARGAVVYIRQSTADQVVNNLASELFPNFGDGLRVQAVAVWD